MMQLHQDRNLFAQKNIKVIVICPETIEGIEQFLTGHELAFDLVADNDHTLATKYGQKVVLLKLGRMPAQLIINKEETVVFRHYAKNMVDIIENKEILAKV